ncbi:arylamine N-acetyltransferase family protein [Paenibacillus paridis]|uniref:arylamine N-acetyltransferase family protein n=1 Tax=Paenibacillus paridis TaxID=2583376 RepID=UPI00111F991C|nr:arylamine N-acetyltransferase [Paenibacillus paridis]
MYIMSKDEIKAYLVRIGIAEIKAPSKAYLFELHKAHIQTLSWQTIDIFARKPASIDYSQSIALVLGGRSGYCFHLNGAFSILLRSLGYKVSLHRAGVQPLGAEPRINSFHLGLTVRLLNEQLEEETWIIDAGLGDMPFEPLPLQYGEYTQAPFVYKVTASGIAEGGWRLEHDPKASFTGVDFDPKAVADLEEFKPKHDFYSRAPESPWFDLFLIRNRSAAEGAEIRGCVLKKYDQNGVHKTELHTKSLWLEALADHFGEKLLNYSSAEKDELWSRVQAAHEDWKRSTAGAVSNA